MSEDVFSQHPHRVRLEWGRAGARRAAERGDIVVVVDVIRFTTTVATALHHGVSVYPCTMEQDVQEYAKSIAAECGSASGRFSLSPLSFIGADRGTRVVLRSPNGATCARYASENIKLFAAGLVNATAVARAVTSLMNSANSIVTVVACGERWQIPSEDGELRFAIEDYLGAGAVIAGLGFDKSPEAVVCESAFQASKHDLQSILPNCASGREQIAKGKAADIEHAAQLDKYDCVPILRDGYFQHR